MTMTKWLYVVPKLDKDHFLITWRIYNAVTEQPIEAPHFRTRMNAERHAKMLQDERDAALQEEIIREEIIREDCKT